MDNLLAHLNQIPPFLCIAIATGRSGGETMAELSQKSGVPIRSLERISSRTTWDGVTVGTASRVAGSCGVSLVSPAMSLRYIRKTAAAKTPLPRLSSIQRKAFNARFEAWVKAKSKECGKPSKP